MNNLNEQFKQKKQEKKTLQELKENLVISMDEINRNIAEDSAFFARLLRIQKYVYEEVDSPLDKELSLDFKVCVY